MARDCPSADLCKKGIQKKLFIFSRITAGGRLIGVTHFEAVMKCIRSPLEKFNMSKYLGRTGL